MQQAAEQLEYERAGEIRDQIRYVEMTVERQKSFSNDNTPRDLFGFIWIRGGSRSKFSSFVRLG